MDDKRVDKVEDTENPLDDIMNMGTSENNEEAKEEYSFSLEDNTDTGNYKDIEKTIKEKTAVDADKVLEIKTKEDEYSLPTSLDELEFPDDEDEEGNEEETDDSEGKENIINNKLKEAVKSKIKPVAKKYDLTAFTISKKPVALNAVLDTIETPNFSAADWVAYNSGYKFRMLGFTGAEIDKLNKPNGNRLQVESIRYKMIFDHIIDKDKPATMEEWAKVTSFFDIENMWFGVFRSTFEGAAYMPITTCPTDDTHVFLTDNLDIMEFVKFENDEAKERFFKIYDGQIAHSKTLYKTDVVPVSNNFAIAFREPSIYNMVFEIAMLDQEFVNKYRDIITIITYIDDIYYINPQTMSLEPIDYKYIHNNVAKTTKNRIIQFAKALRKLSSDQYNALLMYIREITSRGESISYQIPEVTCPECNETIEATPIAGNDLVFMRHQLAALAAL